MKLRLAAALFGTLLVAAVAQAQTVKLGVVNTYSGPFADVGEQLDRGIRDRKSTRLNSSHT